MHMQMDTGRCPISIRHWLIGFMLIIGLAAGAGAREVKVASAGEAGTAFAALAAGDTLVFADGEYALGKVTVTGQGTEAAPITLRAEHTGKATLTGRSSFIFEKAAYVTLAGLVFATTDAAPVDIKGSHHIRVTRNTLRVTETDGRKGGLKWISLGGSSDKTVNSHHNRIDHNLVEGKHTLGQVIGINGLDAPVFQCSQYDRIDHNYFRRIGPRIPNGMETIRTGLSQLSLSSGFTTIEQNLFEECDGDPEVVSVKNCDSTVRDNTFVRCQGGVCLRHGNRATVAGNFFFGEGKRDTHGVRTYGDDHKIFNNYFQDLTGPGLEILNGSDDYPAAPDPARDNNILVKHVRSRRITVAFNSFVDCAAPMVLGGKPGGKDKLVPQDVTLANNLVRGMSEPVKVKGMAPVLVNALGPLERAKWLGNIMWPAGGAQEGMGIGAKAEEVKVADPMLTREGALWRPGPGSPVIHAAQGSFEFVTDDMDGQPRREPKDVGADQVAPGAQVKRRPLTAKDVGPESPEE